jgi:hypothetical protein|tara:strand:+ start:534 stop:848 length:315 start_codon:yes stop_codon:yes gene_type:complete
MGKIKITKASSGKFETTAETFKKTVSFSPWTTPTFKWKKWLLAPYKSAQHWDKFLQKYKKSEEYEKLFGKDIREWKSGEMKKKLLKKSEGGEIIIGKNVDRDLL